MTNSNTTNALENEQIFKHITDKDEGTAIGRLLDHVLLNASVLPQGLPVGVEQLVNPNVWAKLDKGQGSTIGRWISWFVCSGKLPLDPAPKSTNSNNRYRVNHYR